MKTEQIDLIKKSIELLSTEVFPIVNRLKNKEVYQCVIAVNATIRLLETAISNKADLEKHSETSAPFAKKHEEFLKTIMQKIEDKELNGTVIIQTSKNNEMIDAVMSTMSEDELIESIAGLFLNYGPETFIKFLHNMSLKTPKNMRLMVGPMTGSIPEFPFTPDKGGDD